MAKKRAPKAGARRRNPAEELPSDMYDEVDAFHKQRDRVALDKEEDAPDTDDSDAEVPVLGVESLEESEDDMEDVDDIDSDGDEELQAMKAQARALKQRLMIAKGARGGESDEEAGDDARAALRERLWGASKRNYYGGNESASDEEAEEEEEKEARRLQKERAAGIRPEDLGLSSGDEDESSGEGEDEDGEDAALGERVPKGAQVNRVASETGAAMTEEQMREAVRRDAPELESLVGELKGALQEVRGRVAPLLSLVREGKLATDQGISYLEAKHLLLLTYCSYLVFFLLLKAEGIPVKDHPVVQRLVETRLYLEKIRPIDKKLKYQIDKLLKAAERAGGADEGRRAGGAGGEDDDLQLRPNIDAMVTDDARAAGDGDGPVGAYKAPKLREVAMAEDMERSRRKKEERAARELRRRAARSELVRELEAEITGAPREVRDEVPGSDTAVAERERQRIAERERVEEELMTRVHLSKEERRRMRVARTAGLSGADIVDDIADEVVGLAAGFGGDEEDGSDGGAGDGSLRKRLSQKYGGEVRGVRGPRSGDDDAPGRATLGERRAQHDRKRAAQRADEEPDEEGPGAWGEEDDFYKAAKSASKKRREDHKASLATPAYPPLEEPVVRGARAVTTEIMQNPGLTAHRRRDVKAPRKKNRTKFEKALVRHKGQAPAMRERTAGYGGEATGIKSTVTKSRKFKG